MQAMTTTEDMKKKIMIGITPMMIVTTKTEMITVTDMRMMIAIIQIMPVVMTMKFAGMSA